MDLTFIETSLRFHRLALFDTFSNQAHFVIASDRIPFYCSIKINFVKKLPMSSKVFSNRKVHQDGHSSRQNAKPKNAEFVLSVSALALKGKFTQNISYAESSSLFPSYTLFHASKTVTQYQGHQIYVKKSAKTILLFFTFLGHHLKCC